MTDQGNTLFIIEHSLDVMKDADYIVELGPGGGLAGGSLLFAGTPKEMLEAERSDAGVSAGELIDKEKISRMHRKVHSGYFLTTLNQFVQIPW